MLFFQGKLAKSCRNARSFQLVIKRPSVASTVPSGTNTVIGALVYRDIPSDLRSRPEQSHQHPGVLTPAPVRLLQAPPHGSGSVTTGSPPCPFTTGSRQLSSSPVYSLKWASSCTFTLLKRRLNFLYIIIF